MRAPCLEGPFIFMLWVTPCAACRDLARFLVGSGWKGVPLNTASPRCLRDGIAFAKELSGAMGEAVCTEASSDGG